MDRDNCDTASSEPISLQARGGNDDYWSESFIVGLIYVF
jgi:hypothetical protein